MFERLLKVPFPECSPAFTKGHHLDGYNADLRLAFRYYGEQHYRVVPRFHRSEADLKAQQKKDELVADLCEREDITLLIIPYSEVDIERFVRAAITDLGYPIEEVPVRKEKAKGFGCEKCGAQFPTNQKLQRHLARKRPCDPVVDQDDLPEDQRANPNRCRFCGRVYSRQDSLKRHMNGCGIANSEDGMEKLYDHALKKQQARFEKELAKRDEKMAEMAATLEKLRVSTEAPVVQGAWGGQGNPLTLNARTTINVGQLNVVGFNNDPIRIPIDLVKAAFTENPRLIEYCRMSDEERTDTEKAAPYVLEALVDLVRRAHRDPVHRNIYLNPKRTDQVMVCVEEKGEVPVQRWEIRLLADAIRLLFDGVAEDIRKIIITERERKQLPLDVQSAAAWVPNMYSSNPESYVQDGRATMAAHLENVGRSRGFDIMSFVVAK